MPGRIRLVIVALALGALAAAIACRREEATAVRSDSPARVAAAAYVGRAQCARCHAAEARAWQGSQHDLAMQDATPATVLGDFDDATFRYAGTTTRFFRKDGRYVVRTDGPDGVVADFPVAYVFGVYPLQQYLIGLPGGRYQALSIAWDARPAAAGGQRWYHLYPGEAVTHTDVLHWTRFSQNWNAQCATCHTTNLRKGYDASLNAYTTTWSEMDVSCEACHGPGAEHVAWAGRQGSDPPTAELTAAAMGLTASLRDRRGVAWTMQGATGIARRHPAAPSARAEVEVCAPCHARRAERADGHVPGTPWIDSYRPTFLSEGLYRADGQMQDEVYTYGSFLQSRMYGAGVTCSDCHDPHTATLKADGDAVCAQCHLPTTFATTTHHGHAAGTAGASCIACHMPTETYMGVDARHDHGFRIPRPDFTERIGVPNACTRCHDGTSAAWASAALDRWRTPAWRSRAHFAPIVAAARAGRAGADVAVAGLASDEAQPAIVRASAVELLQALASPQLEPTLERLAADEQPLVRLAVAHGLQRLAPQARARIGGRLLEDGLGAVRLDAAAALAGEPADWLTAPQREALERGVRDVRASEAFNADRPESSVNLALLEEKVGNLPAARKAYETSIARAPWFLPAYINLAELQRTGGDEVEAERTLTKALAVAPGDASVLYALGLSAYRQQRPADAVARLRDAAAAAPDVARYPYAYALALESQGQIAQALVVVDTALARHPDDRDLLDAGLSFAQKTGDLARARRYVARLLTVAPGDPALVQLARRLGVE